MAASARQPASDHSSDAHVLDDEALVAAIRQGDARVFEQLFHIHFSTLWRFAYRYVQARDVAEDIVQDVFTSIWVHRATWTVSGDIRTYLFRAVRNRTINAHKHALVEARVLSLDESGERVQHVRDSEPLPDEMVIRAQVRQFVQALPEPRRTAVILRYYEGWSFADIAEVIGSSVKATEMLVARAVRSLRDRV